MQPRERQKQVRLGVVATFRQAFRYGAVLLGGALWIAACAKGAGGQFGDDDDDDDGQSTTTTGWTSSSTTTGTTVTTTTTTTTSTGTTTTTTTSTWTTTTTPTQTGCDPLLEFECGDGSCVFLLWVCDGMDDCSDGSDEVGCGSSVPDGWMCDPSYYGDGDCDCGCGVFDDADCIDATVDSCDYCNDDGSCNTEECPGTIDPTDNAICS